MNHVPPRPGVFEFVTFDAAGQAKVLYLGLATESLSDTLTAHLQGVNQPTVPDLLQRYPNLYFDYVDWSDTQDISDLQDLVAALYEQHRPPHNPHPLVPTGRYEKVELQEVDVPILPGCGAEK